MAAALETMLYFHIVLSWKQLADSFVKEDLKNAIK